MTKHTPVPWEVIGRSVYQIDEIGGREVIHGSGIKGRDSEERDRQDVIEEKEANARFIVTACNCHADLLEACLNALGAYEALEALGADKELPGYEKCLSFLKQAIRKAEES